MPKKVVIPLPPRRAASLPPATKGRSRIEIQVGRQRYVIDITCEAIALPETAPAARTGRVEELQVQTRFLRLCKPAVLGERIDDWRVCWLGGWDKGRVFFVVMVERVCRLEPDQNAAPLAPPTPQS